MNANQSPSPSKPIYRSKTFWLNVVAAVAALCPPVGSFLAANPEVSVILLTGANVLVRLVTKDQVSFYDDSPQPPKSGGSGPRKRPGRGAFSLLWVACMCAGSLGGLPSCKAAHSDLFPNGLQAQVITPNGTRVGYSAKGGLEVESERGAPRRSAVGEK